jgi:hypothetical protein
LVRETRKRRNRRKVYGRRVRVRQALFNLPFVLVALLLAALLFLFVLR